MNGVMAPSSGGVPATLTAGYPVQPTSHLATHSLPPEHTSTIAPQFAGIQFISAFTLPFCFLRSTWRFALLASFVGSTRLLYVEPG